MLKSRVRERLGNLHRRIHVAERCREHEIKAIGGELPYDALGFGAFRHALDIFGLNLVAQGLLHLQTTEIVLVGPAGISNRADVDKADF